jgi:hypothetical protein
VFCFIYLEKKNVRNTRLRRAARCIMARPADEHFYRPSTRCKIEHPTGQISAQRALYVYSATEARFSALKYSALVGDALMVVYKFYVKTHSK